jgi:aryl carrier-like protein
MYDHEYLQLIDQGRNPVQEKICENNLIQAGVSSVEARQVAPLLKKPHCSTDEEALVKSVWKRMLG